MSDLDVLVLADINPDLVLSGEQLEPIFGQTERLAEDARLLIGGSGAIFACGAARLGLRVAIAGVVGDDPFGRFMLEELEARGVETRACQVMAGRPTGISVILSRGEDRSIVTAAGTIGDLRAEDVDRDLLRASRHVHAAAYYLQSDLRPGLAGLFREAHDAGITCSLDPNWDPSERWDAGLREAIVATDVFLPNRAEATAIMGEQDVAEAARRLAELGPTVAVKLGAEGAIAIRDGTSLHAAASPAKVVDATGAGDSFDAGLVTGLLTGWSLERALALGVACGTLSTRGVGGTAAQPTLEEAVGFLDGV